MCEFDAERDAPGTLGAGQPDARPYVEPVTSDCLVGAPVTLDGKPAVVLGTSAKFAIVATLDGSSRFEWSWPTALCIVASGGDFRS
jgi:hypothetical protein